MYLFIHSLFKNDLREEHFGLILRTILLRMDLE